jgi:hypothetical protein
LKSRGPFLLKTDTKTDFIDRLLLLILRNLLKTQMRLKIPAYRLARYFSMTYKRFHVYLTVVLTVIT